MRPGAMGASPRRVRRPARRSPMFRVFDRSVSAILFTLIGVLVAALLAGAATLMWNAYGRYQTSIATRELAQADKALFDAMLYLRVHRGDIQSALLTDDDPRPQ